MTEAHEERETVELVERVPHKSVAYAYVEIKASNANAFMAARNEFLKKHPAYSWALNVPAEPKVKNVEEDAPTSVEPKADEPVGPPEQVPSSATSPSQTTREKARQRMLAKKGA